VNYGTMQTESLNRILREVAKELENRAMKKQADSFAIQLKNLRYGLNDVIETLESQPSSVKHSSHLDVYVEDLSVKITEFFKANSQEDLK